MKSLDNIKVYGDLTFRGDCPTESVEMSTFFNQLPKHLKRIAVHVRNEGVRTASQAAKQRAEGGWVKGAADIIIPGNPCLVIEMKRQDPTKSRVSKEQKEYLSACQANGAMVCIAYGWEAAMEAVREWQKETQ